MQAAVIWGRKVCPLCYLLPPDHRDAHAAIKDVFTHLSTDSSCTQVGA